VLPGAPPGRDDQPRGHAVWPDADSLSALDRRAGPARHPVPGELPERDGLPRESAGWPDAAVWSDPDSLAALDQMPGPARRPDPGVLPGALPERDGPPRESAARPSQNAEPGQDARWAPPPSAERPLSPSGTMLPELPQPRPGNRPSLAAKLSLADLARVRQALELLSEAPATSTERTDDDTDGPVPSSQPAGQQPGTAAADRVGQDETDTIPMPVMLHGAPDAGSAAAPEAPPRAPFEPAQPSQRSGRSEPEPMEEPSPASPAVGLPAAAAAKLDQIKDLLLTAEAIGEHNLDQHFEQVRLRQRELIREFFDQARPDRDAPA
jgi:hypothetical protein